MGMLTPRQALKIDPYLNTDAGLLSPLEHGECFVLADGGETDLDLGNYERYLGIQLSHESNMTTGKVYQHVIVGATEPRMLGNRKADSAKEPRAQG